MFNVHYIQKRTYHVSFLLHQNEQKQMHEILKHLSLQDEKNKESQQSLGQHLNSEAQKQSSLIGQLQQMVAEREAKIKELEEEMGLLTLQVNLAKGINYNSSSMREFCSHF